MTLIKVKEMEPSEIPIKLQEKMAMAEDKLQMEVRITRYGIIIYEMYNI